MLAVLLLGTSFASLPTRQAQPLAVSQPLAASQLLPVSQPAASRRCTSRWSDLFLSTSRASERQTRHHTKALAVSQPLKAAIGGVPPVGSQLAPPWRRGGARLGRNDEVRNDLASCWQQYSETAEDFPSATFTNVDNPKRKCTRDTWQLLVEQRVTTKPGNVGLEAWVHRYEFHVRKAWSASAIR